MYALKSKLHERQKKHKPGNLRTIALDVTPKCNMKCPHCYAETFVNVDPMDLSVLAKALDEAYALGVFHYVLQGGEPIMDPQRLQAIIGMIRPEETYINTVSNGWAMSPDKIRWLKSLGVDKITFSMDSGVPEEHDCGRGAGSFGRVLKAVDDVLAEGLLCSVSTVVTHQNLHDVGFKTILDFAKSKGIRVDVQIAEPVGKWDGELDALVTAEDAAYLKRLQTDYPILPNGQRMINRDIYCASGDHCPAGTEFMSIAADGSTLACNFLQYSLGNIRDRSLREMRTAITRCSYFNGSHPCCPIGEDREFIAKFVTPFKGQLKPLDAHRVFGLDKTPG